MIYKQKALVLLEVLQGKLRIIENISTGAMRMDAQQVDQIIQESKKIIEQLTDMVNIERD